MNVPVRQPTIISLKGSSVPSVMVGCGAWSTCGVASSVRRPVPRFALRRLASAEPRYPIDPAWADPQPELKDALFAAVNADRASYGLPPYQRDPLLDKVAGWKAAQMAWNQYLDHADHAPPVERAFGSRFADFGYGNYALGENIAYGFATAASVEQAFMSDDGHKGNVLSQACVGIGLGVARTNESHAPGLKPADPPLIFWVQDFGSRPVDGRPSPPLAAGSTWRLKRNPLARPVTLLFVSTGNVVTYENTRGAIGHLTLEAFGRRYRRVG